MSSSNDYILVTGSRNLDDGSSDSDGKIQEEDEKASTSALEKQGVSILGDMSRPVSDEPRDQISKELFDESGIEIIDSDEEESYL
jgi:hypothetical protein